MTKILATVHLLASGLTALPAIAQAASRYDAQGYCREVSAFSRGSNMSDNSCIDLDLAIYVWLKGRWSSHAAGMQSRCGKVAAFSGGSCTILESCVCVETKAAGKRSAFKL